MFMKNCCFLIYRVRLLMSWLFVGLTIGILMYFFEDQYCSSSIGLCIAVGYLLNTSLFVVLMTWSFVFMLCHPRGEAIICKLCFNPSQSTVVPTIDLSTTIAFQITIFEANTQTSIHNHHHHYHYPTSK